MTKRLVLLIAAAGLMAGLAASQIVVSYNLADFLPPPSTPEEQYVVARLGADPGAQTLFVVLPQGADQSVVRKALAGVDDVALADELELPSLFWERRLLLGDLPDSEAAWLEVLQERADDLAFGWDERALRYLADDPAGVLLNRLDQLGVAGADTPEHLLVLQSNVPAFDTAQQAALINALGEALPSGSQVLGSAAYGVALEDAVRREATLFSLLASLALALLVFWRFRSIGHVVAVGVPLLFGAAAGALALAIGYPSVHGITLAFGFTLLGVCIDYPLHLLSHNASVRLWPTLLLGVVSTLVAYGAFLLAGTDAIAQLGVFAGVGVVSAAAAALYMSGAGFGPARAVRQASLEHRYWLVAVAVGLPLLVVAPDFSGDLSRLTPIPADTLQRDAEIRRLAGTPDLRYVVVHRGAELEGVLSEVEGVQNRLLELQARGALDGVLAATMLLPARETQLNRRERLALEDFREALQQSPFDDDAFRPFEVALQEERARSDVLSYEVVRAALGERLDAVLQTSPDGWVATTYLRGIRDLEAIADAVELVDLKLTSEGLVDNYRSRLLGVCLGAALLIALLIGIGTRSWRRAVWCMGTLGGAVLLAVAVSAWIHGGLSLFAMLALILAAGLGLDYVLFASRPAADEQERRAGWHAVLLCAVSSGVVFGVLAWSSIPVLQHIGGSVFFGVAFGLLLTWLGTRQGRVQLGQ